MVIQEFVQVPHCLNVTTEYFSVLGFKVVLMIHFLQANLSLFQALFSTIM